MTLLGLALVLAMAGLATAAEVTLGRPVMGTVLQVTVAHPDQESARRFAEEAMAIATHWDDVLTTWRPEGELARLDRAPRAVRVRVGPDLERALRRMGELSESTAGSFDPAVGRLVRWWSRPEADRTREAAPERIPWPRAIEIGDGWVSLAPGASIDAGGIGKGMALDAIAHHLRAARVRSAFLDFGRSSLLAIGFPADEPRGWPVAVAGLESGRLRGVLHLCDRAVSTSRAIPAGDEAGPIVDPATGRPVTVPRLATLIGLDATSAEAWSKALIVRGRAALDSARAAGLEVILEDEGGWIATPELERQLVPGEDRPPRHAGRP